MTTTNWLVSFLFALAVGLFLEEAFGPRQRTRREMSDNRRYALWRWQDLHFDAGLYLQKLYLLRTPLTQIALHWIHMGDPGRDLHDHPRSFVSIVLRGGYWEERPVPRVDGKPGIEWWDERTPVCDVGYRGRFSVAFRRADQPHRISQVEPGTLTLVLWGPKRRTWGFHTYFGWVPWVPYCKAMAEPGFSKKVKS